MNHLYNLPTVYDIPLWFGNKVGNAQEIWQTLALPKIERAKFHRWPLFDYPILPELASQEPLTYGLQAALGTDLEDKSAHLTHAGLLTLIQSTASAYLDSGLIVMDLFEALNEYPDLVQSYLGTVIKDDQDKIVAYNLASLNGGVFIYVPKNLHVSLPIEVSLLVDSRQEMAANKRILIVCEENSQVDYLERLSSSGDQAASLSLVVEVVLKAGARVKYMAIDHLGDKIHAYIKRYAKTDRDSHIDWAIGVLNQGNAILDVDTYLDGNGSEAQVAIVGISSGKQTQVIDSKVVNRGHHTIGNIFQHGVILDRSVLTFNGIGLIENGAKGADAQQESRVLMLSEKARGDANPILLIEEFEVTAGHAASIGQVDQEQLYYLMSRGLPKKVAEYLVIRGFLGPVILSMPSDRVRQELLNVMDDKLASLSEEPAGASQ